MSNLHIYLKISSEILIFSYERLMQLAKQGSEKIEDFDVYIPLILDHRNIELTIKDGVFSHEFSISKNHRITQISPMGVLIDYDHNQFKRKALIPWIQILSWIFIGEMNRTNDELEILIKNADKDLLHN